MHRGNVVAREIRTVCFLLLLACGIFAPVFASATTIYAWTAHSATPGTGAWYSISSGGSALAAVALGADVWTSPDNGTTWVDRSAAGARNWQSVTMFDSGVGIVAAVNTGDLFVSTSTGATWEDVSSAGSQAWHGVSASSNGSVMAAVVDNGDIYVSTTTGASWTDMTSSGLLHNAGWNAVAVSPDGSTIVAAVYGGEMYVSTTTGATWTLQSPLGSRNWTGIATNSNGSQIIASASGSDDIYMTTNGGTTWAAASGPPTANWSSVSMSGNGAVLAGAISSGDIWTSADGGATWLDNTAAGSRSWTSINVASDGSTIEATAYFGDIWTAIPDAPAVTLTAPSSGATFSNQSITFTATTTDSATNTSQVQFYVDNTLQATITGSSPYSTSIDSSNFGNAAHTAYAVVESAAGGYATSSSVSFTVNNVAATTPTASQSAGLPWCSGPMAPGWNSNLPGGGCGASSGTLGTPIVPVATPSVSTPALAASYDFTRDLHKGMTGTDVRALQQYLNAGGFQVAASGPGSPGNETDYFGQATAAALIRFQDAHASQILAPEGLTEGTGYFGAATRAFVNGS